MDQRTLHAAARRFFEAFARTKPVCLMFEDIHWAEAALLDLIEFIAGRAKEAPLLVLAQTRPSLLEKRPSWGSGVRAFTSLPLDPLSVHHGRELIGRSAVSMASRKACPPKLAKGLGGIHSLRKSSFP